MSEQVGVIVKTDFSEMAQTSFRKQGLEALASFQTLWAYKQGVDMFTLTLFRDESGTVIGEIIGSNGMVGFAPDQETVDALFTHLRPVIEENGFPLPTRLCSSAMPEIFGPEIEYSLPA